MQAELVSPTYYRIAFRSTDERFPCEGHSSLTDDPESAKRLAYMLNNNPNTVYENWVEVERNGVWERLED